MLEEESSVLLVTGQTSIKTCIFELYDIFLV